MKISVKLILTVLIFTTISLGQLFAGGQRARANRFSIAGGPVGGAYFALSLGIADVLMREIEGWSVDVVTTAGAIENPFLVGQRENDFGLATGEMILAAYQGTGIFAGHRQSDLRVMFSGVAGGAWHLITHQNITSIDQLRGSHIAIGPEGNVTAPLTFIVFRHLGLNPGDITTSFLSFADGMTALSDGRVAASLATGAPPLAAVQELAANVNFPFRIHSISRSVAYAVVEENPAYGVITIPRGTYSRQDEDVLTIGTTNFMVVNANVPDDVVYQIVRTIFENLDTVHMAHASARALTLDVAGYEIIPMHPGARRFFRDRGVIP